METVQITALVLETGRLIAHISGMISNVRNNRAKERCNKLLKQACLIKALLLHRADAIDTFGVADEAQSCISEIKHYVDQMSDTKLLADISEVWWTQKYVKIHNTAKEVKEKFQTALVARTDFHPLRGLGPDGALRPRATFKVADPSAIVFQGSVGRGDIVPHGKIVCYPAKDSRLSLRSLEMYPRLQERAYVQQLKGLAEVNHVLYVFMQDFDSNLTLDKLDKNVQRPDSAPLALAERVEIAYKIAKTVAWYHQSDMVLKTIYDHRIIMEPSTDGRLTPILTGLDHMRHIYEKSTQQRYDCRYEAPEFRDMRQHSFKTDVWSLGIIAWQVICEQFPYGLRQSVDSSNQALHDKIRKNLESYINPGEFPQKIPAYLANGLKQCWNRDVSKRPESAAVANFLQDAWMQLLSTSTPEVNNTTDLQLSGEMADMSLSEPEVPESAIEQVEMLVLPRRQLSADAEGEEIETPPEKLPLECITALNQAAAAGNAKCAFLIGASVWWELLDDNALRFIDEVKPSNYITTTDYGQRAELALMFLERAVRGQCKDGYLEMQHAFSLLSGLYGQKHAEITRRNRHR